MSKQQAHIIHRQNISIQLPDQSGVHQYQERVSRLCRDILHPQLEKLFSSFVDEDTWISIDKLEIDLGVIRPNRLEKDWVSTVLKATEKALGQLLAPSPMQITSQNKHVLDLAQTSNPQKQSNLLLFFLKHGYLPWWGQAEVLEEYIDNLPNKLSNVLPHFLQTIKSSPASQKRLILQLKDEQLISIGKMILPSSAQKLASLPSTLLKEMADLHAPHQLHSTYRLRIWKTWLAEVLFVLDQSGPSLVWIRSIIKQWGINVLEIFSQLHPTHKHQIPPVFVSILGNQPHISFKSAIDKPFLNRVEKLKQSQKEETVDINDDLYLSNAGLILFHPFLEYLFEDLGFVKNGAFISQVAQQQAIYLLQYLAHGNKDQEEKEYELVLNKVLCGWPLETPLDVHISLTDAHYKAADEMLDSLFEYWEVMKQLEVEGLRVMFLHRNGKLNQKAHFWQLYVEQQTTDILLDKIPWGIRLISLPWMDGLLQVEWN